MKISNDISDFFKIELQNHCAKQIQQKSVTSDRLVINVGEPRFIEIKRSGSWERKRYHTGDFSIVPYARENTVRWFEDIKFVVIEIEPGFIPHFFQIKDFSLAEYRGITDKIVYDFATEFKREMDYVQTPAKIYIQSLAICLSIHLGTQYQASGKTIHAPKGKLSSVQLKTLLDYFQAFSQNNFGVDDLAALVHLSPFHFIRIFKNTLGVAPHHYVLQLKIERAKQLIKKNENTLSAIAYDLGFADQAHLSNTFRKFAGISPSEFMRA